MKKITLLISLLVLLCAAPSHGQTIVSDTYQIATSGTGFDLGSGVNTGINPPINRMTGTVAEDLRYIKTAGARADSLYDIGSNRLRVRTENTIGRFSISGNGATPFDFGPALGSSYASPTNPAVYEIRISMRNDADSNARFSFALATAEDNANNWDFGVQLYRAGSDDFYSVRKRIHTASSGVASINEVMTTTAPGSHKTLIPILIRVTDAGTETNSFSSRIEVSLNNGVDWVYDTSTNIIELPNGFRFDGAGRYLVFDQAGNTSGNVFYDNLSVVSTYAPPPPPPLVWTGGGADDFWSTVDNWGGTVPTTGTPLVFDGTTRQTNVNDLTDLAALSLAFNNGGFALSGNPFSVDNIISNLAGVNTLAADLSLSAPSTLKNWSIADGSELVLDNVTSIEVGGDNGITDGGTLRLKGTMNIGQATTENPAFIIYDGKHVVDGGAFTSRGGYRIGSSATGSGGQTILTNGATINLTAAGANFRVGDSANPSASRLEINDSTLTMAGGSLGIPYVAGATGEVVQIGGVVSGGNIAFNDNGAGTGAYTIQNGTLEPLQIREDTAAGSSSISFDNAILRPAPGANPAFFSGVDVAEIQAGGLTIDATADVTIAQNLSGVGSLTKSGFATATLTGSNTYSGDTVVQSGKLVFTTTQTNATIVQVADGAEFGVSAQSSGSTLSIAALNFNGGSFNTLSFDLGNFSSPTAPMMKVPVLSVGGPVVINVANGLQLTAGQYVLVDYDNAIAGGFQFTLGSLPPGVSASLVNNGANSSIDLNITGVPGFRWTGAVNGDWDFGTANWIDQQTMSASSYSDGFPTEFFDGAANTSIEIAGFVSPSLISVSNNTLPYVWSNGAITTSLVKKSGTNSLTRVEGGADFIDEIELNEGSFAVSSFFDGNFTTVLTDISAGDGTFVKQGANTLTFTTNHNTYDGTILVQEGILKLGVAGSLGTTNGGTTIASGATLDLNDIIAPHEPVIVSGHGVGGQGAIIDSTAGTGVAHNLTDVTMVGHTTLGAPNGRWDIRVRSSTGPGPGLRGNGFDLTKVGPGFLSIACQRNLGVNTPYWEMNLGDIVINEGTLAIAESLSLGNPSKNITVNSGATFQLFDLGQTNPIVRNIFMTDARILSGGGNADTNILNGSISLTGINNSLRMDQAVLIINGSITGSGPLAISANEPGRVYLNGVNSYAGDTVVTNGTLGGTGSLAGNLIMLDGTHAPGVTAGAIGTFTVNGDATLAGTTLMELDRGLSPNSDRLIVGGTLTFGGTLTVALGSGASAPQAGDVYQLFNKGSGSTFSLVNLPDLSALPGGLAWDTSNLNVNGTITVTGTATPPTIDSVSASGGNFVFSGTGGIEGNTYHVLSSTDVALPVASWTPVATNVFGPGGSFSYTNVINPAAPETFFLLQLP